jgi:hypothetical protein
VLVDYSKGKLHMIIGFVRIARVGSYWSVSRTVPRVLPSHHAHDVILVRSLWRALAHALWIARNTPRI